MITTATIKANEKLKWCKQELFDIEDLLILLFTGSPVSQSFF